MLTTKLTSSTFLKNNTKRHCKLIACTRRNFYFMIENLHVARNKTKSVLISRKTLNNVHKILVKFTRYITNSLYYTNTSY